MNSYYKIFVSSILVATALSICALFADSEIRKKIVDELAGLVVNSQGTVVDFLFNLYKTDSSKFQRLFDYVVNKKSIFDYNFAFDLREQKLTGEHDNPSVKLDLTFKLLKQIVDDYNKEKKINCCKLCCGGCFVPWCRENGIKMLEFTSNNVAPIIAVLSCKNMGSMSQEPLENSLEYMLACLSTVQIY